MANRVAPFYNVDAPVGKGKSNKPDDVLLVRWFLSQIKGSAMSRVIGFDPPGTLPVTTSWDEQLTEWQAAMHPSVKVPKDGIVDPARGTSSQTTTIHGGIFTIVLLNNADKTNQEKSHAALWLDERVPAQLRAALAANVH